MLIRPFRVDGRFRATVCVLALLVQAVGLSCGGKPAPPPVRNVLLIVVDTLRAGRLGCYGYERSTTPNIDALAARGTLYENAHSQGSNTRYSMISMMSGLYITDVEERLPTEFSALAETIKASGRTTAAFVGNKPLAGGSRGFQRGFDHFEEPRSDGTGSEIGRSKQIVGQFTNWYTENQSAIRTGEGFFAWVHMMDPHKPYTAPKTYRDRLSSTLPGEQRLQQVWDDPAPVALAAAEADGDAGSDIEAMVAANNDYDAQVARLDENIGALIDFLRAQGELDDTLIILAADHGEIIYDRLKYPEEIHAWWRLAAPERRTLKELYFYDHGVSFHEELWHTPLILAGPGFPAGVRRTTLAANLDIYPTVVQAIGMQPSDHLRGKSLLGGVESNHESVFAYTIFIDAVLGADGWKLIDRRRKLKEYYEPVDVVPESLSGALELYDLNTDPYESKNVAAEHPERVAAMSKLLRDWKKQNERARDTAPLTDEDLQGLIELGYIQEAAHHGAVIKDDDK